MGAEERCGHGTYLSQGWSGDVLWPMEEKERCGSRLACVPRSSVHGDAAGREGCAASAPRATVGFRAPTNTVEAVRDREAFAV